MHKDVSPAEKVGIRGGTDAKTVEANGIKIKLGGDIILKADGTNITNIDDLKNIKNQKKAGDNLSLTLLRDGQTIEDNIILDANRDSRMKYPSDWRPTPIDDHTVRFNPSSSYQNASGNFQEAVWVSRLVNSSFLSFIMLSRLFPNILRNMITSHTDANITINAIDPVNIGPDNLPAYKMLAVNNNLGIGIMVFFLFYQLMEDKMIFIL